METQGIKLNTLGDLDVTLVKKSKIFNIQTKHSNESVLIKCYNITVRTGFTINQFKTSGDDGQISIDLGDDAEYIDLFDLKVQNEFSNMYLGKIENNVKMTRNSIVQMFKPSTYMSYLRLNISKASCSVFDEQKQLKLNTSIDYFDILKENTKVNLLIEPKYLWMMNQKIGLHWDIKQIWIENQPVNTKVDWSLLFDNE